MVLYERYWTSFRCNGRTVGDIEADNIICRARQLSTFDVDVALYIMRGAHQSDAHATSSFMSSYTSVEMEHVG